MPDSNTTASPHPIQALHSAKVIKRLLDMDTETADSILLVAKRARLDDVFTPDTSHEPATAVALPQDDGTMGRLCAASSPPISKLAPELLLAIFELCPFATFDGVETALCLAAVCRRWKDLAFALPTLWASMTLYADRELSDGVLEAWLQRSLQYPLDLHLTVSSEFDASGSIQHAAPFMLATVSILLEELPRWRKLYIRPAVLVPCLESTLAPLFGNAVRLEEIYVQAEGTSRIVSGLVRGVHHTDGRVVYYPCETLFSKNFHAPQLQHLDLGEARYFDDLIDPRDLALFTALRTLIISWEALDFHLNAAQLARIVLMHLPRLRHLHLIGRMRRNRPLDWARTVPNMGLTYDMPSLEHIVFEQAELNDIVEFTEAITAPLLVEITWKDMLGYSLDDSYAPVEMISDTDHFPLLHTLILDSLSDVNRSWLRNLFRFTQMFTTYELNGPPWIMGALRLTLSEENPCDLWGAPGMQAIELAGDVSGEWALDFVAQLDATREAHNKLALDPETMVLPLEEMWVTAYTCKDLPEDLRAELEDSVPRFEWRSRIRRQYDHFVRLHRDTTLRGPEI